MLGLLCAGLTGCSTLGWYSQAARGQLELLVKRKDIENLLDSPTLEPERRRKLQRVLEIRAFAADELALPHDGSYGDYVALERDAVVWNVIAAPEFDVAPRTWCYPIAGCVSYRGYFERGAAEHHAERLAREGYDVLVAPVAAYSTLGRFDDPVTSPMLAFDAVRLAGLLFHELAHQRVYVPGDTRFNESYATAVERAGVRRWLTDRGEHERLRRWSRERDIAAAFTELLLTTRAELAALYRRELPEPRMRAGKQAAFERLRQRYRSFRERFDTRRYDRWMARDLNNAHLALTATYEAGTDAFARLLAEYDGDFARFHDAAERLAGADRSARAEFLNRCRTLPCP